MYHYIEDKDFLKRMKSVCSDIVNQLVQSINNDSAMKVRAYLVGSGGRNLVTQNENEPVDLDYNIVVDRKTVDTISEHEIKGYIKKHFNKVLKVNGWGDCDDSTSVLTTEQRVFKKGNKTPFKIDVAITCYFNGRWHRLIHDKTGFIMYDRWFWNEVPSSRKLDEKVSAIKSNNLWMELRDVYLDKKNLYLCRNDFTHPSFVVYVEAMNQVYNKYF